LELLLSVAVGSQLGDVFLHLLPEAFSHPDASSIYIGLWTLIGLLLFFLIEQIFPDNPNEDSESKIKVEISIKKSNKSIEFVF
jgi:zinc transporter 13